VSLRVAALAYPIERLADFTAFCAKQRRLVAEAAAAGAQLLLFPEYASLELTSQLPQAEQGDLARELAALVPMWREVHEVYRALARQHGVTIVAPSEPEPESFGQSYVNRAHVFTPEGVEGMQEKLLMTRFEREEWGIAAGTGQSVFDSPLGPFAVAICYDSEFPMLVRRLVDAGARIILVPSCTDTLAGYHRVALSCRARALENQCFVVSAGTVGSAPWSRALDVNHGAGAIYGPVDRGFASDGVVAQGPLGVAGWVYADLDLEALDRVRREGQVKNHEDWALPAHQAGEVTRVSLNA
jgi:predicted amidohydrolase